MDPMSDFDIRLVFTLPSRDSTLHCKRCVHLGNNFPCITTLIRTIQGLPGPIGLIHIINRNRPSSEYGLMDAARFMQQLYAGWVRW